MFRESFKYYKSKKQFPSLKEVIDFEKSELWCSEFNRLQISNSITSDTWKIATGLTDPTSWDVFELINKPGLIFIRNPFKRIGQRYWIKRCLRDFPVAPNRTNLKDKQFVFLENGSSSNQLRWVTLGYHHNWDTKEYSEDMKNDFPHDLGELSKLFSEILGFSDFKAEAAIVNYYYLDSTLSGHNDVSEDNLEAPLFSFSFGQSAIFLLGGRSLEEKPTAILIKSGDVLIMTKESRLSYHGVPKILKETDSSRWNCLNFEDDQDWFPYEKFMETCRINMNVRQVLYKSQTVLSNTNKESK